MTKTTASIDPHRRKKRLRALKERVKKTDKISEYNQELLLEDFVRYLESQDQSLSRRLRYLQNWKDLAEHIDWRIDEPTEERIQRLYLDYKAGRVTVKGEDELSGWQIYEAKKAIRQMFVHFGPGREFTSTGEDIIPFSMTPPKSSVKEYEVLRPSDVGKLIDYSPHLRDQLLICLAFSSAARISELLSLRWKDVEITSTRGHRIASVTYSREVSRGQKTKTETREVPLREGLVFAQRFKEKDSLSDEPDTLVFRKLNSTNPQDGLSYNGARDIFVRALERVKESDTDWDDRRKTNPHNFRHSRATYWASEGLSENQIRNLGGWGKDSEVVKEYIHLGKKDAEKAVLQFHGLEPEDDSTADLEPVPCPDCGKLNEFHRSICRDSGCRSELSSDALAKNKEVERRATELAYEAAQMEGKTTQERIKEKAKELVSD